MNPAVSMPFGDTFLLSGCTGEMMSGQIFDAVVAASIIGFACGMPVGVMLIWLFRDMEFCDDR